MELKRVCVFAGSKEGGDPAYRDAAVLLGRTLAERGIGVVYGAASIGLMGAVANAALGAGGEAIGIIPQALQRREVAHRGLTELHVVPSMHERKAQMGRLSDAFVALPGGLGTFEELLEVTTWSQLGIHAKPIGTLNVRGYFNPLAAMLDRAVEEAFLAPEHRRILLSDEDPGGLLDRIEGLLPIAPAPASDG